MLSRSSLSVFPQREASMFRAMWRRSIRWARKRRLLRWASKRMTTRWSCSESLGRLFCSCSHLGRLAGVASCAANWWKISCYRCAKISTTRELTISSLLVEKWSRYLIGKNEGGFLNEHIRAERSLVRHLKPSTGGICSSIKTSLRPTLFQFCLQVKFFFTGRL